MSHKTKKVLLKKSNGNITIVVHKASDRIKLDPLYSNFTKTTQPKPKLSSKPAPIKIKKSTPQKPPQKLEKVEPYVPKKIEPPSPKKIESSPPKEVEPSPPKKIESLIPSKKIVKEVKGAEYQIDLVYTWVDGSDPEWRTSRSVYLDDVKSEASYSETRYRDLDELRYSLMTVEKFAPFIRKIFIVTSGQVPKFLSDDRFKFSIPIVLVNHQEIFPKEFHTSCLPTFNSITIEANLHRIAGLSEYFIYFNDDVFFGRKVKVSDFIDLKSGRTWVHLKDKPIEVFSDYDLTDYSFRHALSHTQDIFNRLFKLNGSRPALQHLGKCLQKSVLFEIEDILSRFGIEESYYYLKSCSRFRRTENLTLMSYFYGHYALIKGYGLACSDSVGQSISRDHDDYYESILDEKPLMFCLNSLPQLSSKFRWFFNQLLG